MPQNKVFVITYFWVKQLIIAAIDYIEVIENAIAGYEARFKKAC